MCLYLVLAQVFSSLLLRMSFVVCDRNRSSDQGVPILFDNRMRFFIKDPEVRGAKWWCLNKRSLAGRENDGCMIRNSAVPII